MFKIILYVVFLIFINNFKNFRYDNLIYIDKKFLVLMDMLCKKEKKQSKFMLALYQ